MLSRPKTMNAEISVCDLFGILFPPRIPPPHTPPHTHTHTHALFKYFSSSLKLIYTHCTHTHTGGIHTHMPHQVTIRRQKSHAHMKGCAGHAYICMYICVRIESKDAWENKRLNSLSNGQNLLMSMGSCRDFEPPSL